MNITRSFQLFVAAGLVASASLLGAPNPPAAWRAADDARVAAMLAADPAKLAATISDDLLYVHSDGRSETKATLVTALTSGTSAYRAIDYEQREFREVSPGLVLMHGRCRTKLGKDAPFSEIHLSFLAAYRLESGIWRFLAWQSSRIPEPAAPPKS